MDKGRTVDVAILIARTGLALVLIVAGIAKSLDRRSTREAVPELGLPEVLAAPIAVALPIVEIAIGILLLPAPTARLAAVAASLLFASFSVVVGLALVRGRRPECNCFGPLSSGPIGPGTIVRSGLLAVAAGFVAVAWVEPALELVGWLRSLPTSERALLAVDSVILLAVGTLAYTTRRLFVQQGMILRRLEDLEATGQTPTSSTAVGSAPAGLPVGTVAPAFSLPRTDGTSGSLAGLLREGKPVLLVFLNPVCAPCKLLLPEVARWNRQDASLYTIGLVSRGDMAKNRQMSEERGLPNVLVQQGADVNAVYGVTGTPTALLIGVDGTIASPLANGAREIKALVASIGGSARAPEESHRTHAHSHAGDL